MKKFLKVSLLALLAAMAMALLVACGGSGNGDEAKVSDEQGGYAEAAPDFTASNIAVTYVLSPLNVPSIVERERGIFEAAFAEFDLPVEYSTLTAGPDQTAALASGDIHFLFNVGGVSVIQAAAGGLDIRIISMYNSSPEVFNLFTKDDSIQSAEDLEGRTVAGPPGTVLHQMLVAYLNTAGLSMDDIDFHPMGIPEAAAALEGGAVDMALLAGPAAFNAEQDGARVVTNGEGLIEGTSVVATSESFYQENRVLVQRFLEAQNEILEFIDANLEESLEMTAEETGLPLEGVEAMYPLYDFRMEILDSDIAALEETMQFMLDTEMIDEPVDIRSLILDVQN